MYIYIFVSKMALLSRLILGETWRLPTLASAYSKTPWFNLEVNPSSIPWRVHCGRHRYTLSSSTSGPKTHSSGFLGCHGLSKRRLTPKSRASFRASFAWPFVFHFFRSFFLRARICGTDLCTEYSIDLQQNGRMRTHAVINEKGWKCNWYVVCTFFYSQGEVALP